MSTADLTELFELLGQEQACYTQLLDLSRHQKQCINEGEVEPLMAILEQKQEAVQSLQRLEERLAPYIQNWAHLRGSWSCEDRQKLDMALESVEELLRELIATEKASEAMLHRRPERKAPTVQRVLGRSTSRSRSA